MDINFYDLHAGLLDGGGEQRAQEERGVVRPVRVAGQQRGLEQREGAVPAGGKAGSGAGSAQGGGRVLVLALALVLVPAPALVDRGGSRRRTW